MAIEKSEKSETSFKISERPNDFGYIRIRNLCEPEFLEERFTSSFIQFLIDNTAVSREAVAIRIEIPKRPRTGKVLPERIEQMQLSMAELAGAASALRLVTETDSFIYTFDQLDPVCVAHFYNLSITLEAPDVPEIPKPKTYPKQDTVVSPLQDENLLHYQISSDLFKTYGIKISEDSCTSCINLKLGSLKVTIDNRGHNIFSDTSALSELDFHLLRGYLQAITLLSFTHDMTIPSVNLVNQPLSPYSDLEGTIPTTEIVAIKRIPSYY